MTNEQWTPHPGRTVWSVVLGMALYVALGIVAYGTFYDYYDAHGVASETAFKFLFLLTMAGHVLATLIASGVVARLLRARVRVVLTDVAIGAALLLLPSLAVLATVNDCMGVAFPWDGGCPE